MEGRSDRHLIATKQIMTQNPEILHRYLSHLAEVLTVYVCHQIDCGAQVVQLFDSWAHHLYMAEFREYSNKYGFRHRSETPEIAIELSLQPWRAFKPDGVIMFSDILTPLPAIGVEFDVVKVRIFIRSVSNGTPTFPFHKYVLLVADLT